MGVPKFPNSQLWGPITLFEYLRLIWNLKQSCSPHWELFNGMSYATCMQGNRGDSWLLWSGVKLAIWLMALLLTMTCVSCVQMNHTIPFQTSTFQELFNDIREALIQWVLAPVIVLWRFRSPSKLQFPKWELTWECEGSFPHTLLLSWEHEMWLLGSFLARTFPNLYLGHEPKARVVTKSLTYATIITPNISMT